MVRQDSLETVCIQGKHLMESFATVRQDVNKMTTMSRNHGSLNLSRCSVYIGTPQRVVLKLKVGKFTRRTAMQLKYDRTGALPRLH